MTISKVFEALSHPLRRQVLQHLRQGPMSAGDLADRFAVSKPTMSVHFAKLRDAELVSAERRGTSIIYHLNTSLLEETLSGLLDLGTTPAKEEKD